VQLSSGVKGLFSSSEIVKLSEIVKFRARSYETKRRNEGLILARLRAYFRTNE